MTQDKEFDLKKFLSIVLEKKRNCIPLTTEEQKKADEIYGSLFEKKFGNRHFVVKTGEEIRKNMGKPSDVQPDAAIADERSKFHTKDSKIENDDPSGTVKETEDGDNVNVDEKDEPEAKNENASDIINSDKDDMQRKPTLKFDHGDVVVKMIHNNAYAGVIVKAYEKEQVALVKWSVGTFSYTSYTELEKVADKYGKEKSQIEPPISADNSEGTKVPGTDTDKEHVGLAVNKDAYGKPVVKDDMDDDDDIDEEDETPADEADETPEEQAEEDAEGTEEHNEPNEVEVSENEWMSRCMKGVGENPNVTDSKSICMFVRTTMKKSNEKVIKMDIEDVRKSNPKLAEQMEKDGHKELNFDTEKFEKSE